MKQGFVFGMVILSASLAHGQVIITSQDMFNAIGQYYRVYANANGTSTDVTGLAGNPGGPQTWDFTTGPQTTTYRFDYVNINDGGNGTDFTQAKFAERQTDESTSNAIAWLYLDQVPGVGRRNYGYVNPGGDPTEGLFNPFIVDFPDPLKYQASWTAKTTYDFTVLGVLPARINYTASATVDAFGTIILPILGSSDCLRVNELDQYDTLVDMDLTGNYQPLETDYVRSYYFFRPGHGIAAEIVSQQSTSTAPDNNFTQAAQFVRMFESSRSSSTNQPSTGIAGLKLTIAQGVPQLSWNSASNVTAYQVQYTSNLLGTISWQPLATTTNTSYLDSSITNSPLRFYRVASTNQ
jgi:hypothetical protein